MTRLAGSVTSNAAVAQAAAMGIGQLTLMESFFHTLKTELVHHRQYATRAEATRDIFAYIEGFYNRTRRHSAIGYMSPIAIELKAA